MKPQARRPVRKANKKQKQSRRNMKVPLHRTPGHLLPQELETVLTFSQLITLSNVSAYGAYPYYSNAPFDIDPALGSTATLGLTQFSGFYNQMRAVAYNGSAEFISTGTATGQFFCLHSPTDLGVTSGGANYDLRPYIGNPGMQRFSFGHSYSPQGKHVFKFSKTIPRIVGSPQPLTDDKYASTVGAVPTIKTFIYLGAVVDTSTLSNCAVRGLLLLNIRVRFFDRKSLPA